MKDRNPIDYLKSWAAPVWREHSVGELIKSTFGGIALVCIGTVTTPMYRNVISCVNVLL